MNTPTVGTKVIKVRYPRFGHGDPSYSNHTVKTVWKNGVFFLDGDYDSNRWTGYTNRDGDWEASASGKGYYSAGTLYLADNATVAKQREAARVRRDGIRKVGALAARLGSRYRAADLTPEQLAAVEAALAVFPGEPSEQSL